MNVLFAGLMRFFNFILEKDANFMPKAAEDCIYQHFTTYEAFYTSGITKE